MSDNSTDNTNSIIAKYTKRYRQIKYITGRKKLGKGGALIRGFRVLSRKYRPDVIGFIDADSSVSGKQVIRLLGLLKDNRIDGVIASRYLKGSRITGVQGRTRFIASRGYNGMIRLLFGVDFKDTQCGAKFFKANAIYNVLDRLYLTDFSFDINLLYELHKSKFNVIEVPISYNIVEEGSKVYLKKHITNMFFTTLGYRLGRSRTE